MGYPNLNPWKPPTVSAVRISSFPDLWPMSSVRGSCGGFLKTETIMNTINKMDENIVPTPPIIPTPSRKPTPAPVALKSPSADHKEKVEIAAALSGYEADEKKVRELIGSIDTSESEVAEMRKKLASGQHAGLENALKAGEILCRLKEAHKKANGHGTWETYVTRQLGCTPRKASMYMRFHTRRRDLEKSEIFPKLGIAEAEKLLQKLDKAGNEDAEGTSGASDPAAPVTDPPDHGILALADEGNLRLADIGWSEGLISRSDLAQLLGHNGPAARKGIEAKSAARQQRIIATIAADVNRSCAGEDPSEARTSVCAALETIRAFLANPGQPGDQPAA